MLALHYETIDSTNEEAKRLIRAATVAQPAFLLAREQTAGKGRHGRSWVSPKDAGIYLTVIDFPQRSPDPDTTPYTLAAGVASAAALRDTAGVEVGLKPINDLYVAGRKLGGILTETMVQQERVQALIVGVGINVHHADRSSVDGPVKPVCLAELMPMPEFARLDVERLVATLVTRIMSGNREVSSGAINRVRASWLACAIPGVSLPDG